MIWFFLGLVIAYTAYGAFGYWVVRKACKDWDRLGTTLNVVISIGVGSVIWIYLVLTVLAGNIFLGLVS